MRQSAGSETIPAALLALCAAVAIAGTVWSGWEMFGPAQEPIIQGWDDSHYYFWLPSVVIDGDVDFSNQIANADTLTPAARESALAQQPTRAGLLPNKYPPGWALASLPFFLAAHATAPAGATGFEARYMVAVWIGHLFYAAAGLWLAVRVVSRFFPAHLAAVAVPVIWLASPLAYYQSARLAMSHSLVFALFVATTWAALRIANGDTRRRTWFLLGFSAAMMVVTRNAAVVYLVFPAAIAAQRMESWKPAAWLALGTAGPAVAQLIAWKMLYGSWIVYSYGEERIDPTSWHVAEVLFSPLHGWFYWHPLLLLSIGAFVAWAVRRFEGRLWLVSLASILALNSMWPSWWLGSSFGHRGFEAALLFAMLGGAALMQAVRTRPWLRSTIATAACLAIAWNMALLALFLTQRIPREKPVTYGDAAGALVRWVSPPSHTPAEP